MIAHITKVLDLDGNNVDAVNHNRSRQDI